MTIKYPDFVDKNNIDENGNPTYRYSLSIPFTNPKGQKGKLFVILKNPSKATSQNADVTVSKVCYVAYNNGYSNVTIFNLFPLRATDATELINFYNCNSYNSEMRKNLNMIVAATNNNDVLFAWGTNTISDKKQYKALYDSAIANLINSITPSNKFYVTSRNKDGYPLHGQHWSHEAGLLVYI